MTASWDEGGAGVPLWAEQIRSALRRRVEGDIARRLGVPPAEYGRPPSGDLAARFHWAARSLRP